MIMKTSSKCNRMSIMSASSFSADCKKFISLNQAGISLKTQCPQLVLEEGWNLQILRQCFPSQTGGTIFLCHTQAILTKQNTVFVGYNGSSIPGRLCAHIVSDHVLEKVMASLLDQSSTCTFTAASVKHDGCLCHQSVSVQYLLCVHSVLMGLISCWAGTQLTYKSIAILI